MSAQHKDPRTQAMINEIMSDESFLDTLKEVYDRVVRETSDNTLARFKQAIDVVLSAEVKATQSALRAEYPITRGSSAGADNTWRQDLKTHFGGRGRQWVRIEISDIEPTLARLEADGHNTEQYKTWIANAGYAWVRYAGPRIHNDAACAAFEVRLQGSKLDHIGLYHFVPASEAFTLEFLPNTPFGLALER